MSEKSAAASARGLFPAGAIPPHEQLQGPARGAASDAPLQSLESTGTSELDLEPLKQTLDDGRRLSAEQARRLIYEVAELRAAGAALPPQQDLDVAQCLRTMLDCRGSRPCQACERTAAIILNWLAAVDARPQPLEGDREETTSEHPKSWAAWKRRAEKAEAERDEWSARFNKLPEIVERAEERGKLAAVDARRSPPREIRYTCGCVYRGDLASAACPTHPSHVVAPPAGAGQEPPA